MQNILKALKVLISALLLLTFLRSSAYGANSDNKNTCNIEQKNGVYQYIQSQQLGCIEFVFSKKSRIVSLKAKNNEKKSMIVKSIEHYYSRDLGGMVDFSPELVGMVDHMGFISPKTIFYEGHEYLALIYYERSSGGNGGGECGAGAEGFLVSYQLSPGGFKKRFSKLVDSCGGNSLEEFPKNSVAPIYVKDSYIYVDWGMHEKFGLNGAIGKIRVSDGTIECEKKITE